MDIFLANEHRLYLVTVVVVLFFFFEQFLKVSDLVQELSTLISFLIKMLKCEASDIIKCQILYF